MPDTIYLPFTASRARPLTAEATPAEPPVSWAELTLSSILAASVRSRGWGSVISKHQQYKHRGAAVAKVRKM